jgi:short-subunit dehydrogenase
MKRGLHRELSNIAALAAVRSWALGSRTNAALFAGAAGFLRFISPAGQSLRARVVVITGGSRGLGLALADRFLDEGARVALFARDRDELSRAGSMLGPKARGHVLALECDVVDPAGLADAIRRVERSFGRVDVLVNNAGSIFVGPLDVSEHADFDEMLDLSVHAIVSGTKAVIPIFRRQGRGQIVNICSLGGKIGVPHLGAYCAGKFALAGLSQSMGAELARDKIDVTTVYPGMMRVGSTIQARFKGDPEKEYAWFATMSVLPGISISAERAARRIVDAVRHRDAEVIFPATAKLAALSHAAFPEISAWVASRAARQLPGGDARTAKSGAASRSWLESRLWFRPLRAKAALAQMRWNQRDTSGVPSGLDE